MNETINRLKLCLRDNQYRVGIALFVGASILSAIFPEKETPGIVLLISLLLTVTGGVISNSVYANLIFEKMDAFEKKKIICKSILAGLPLGVIMAMVFFYIGVFSLSWIIMGISVLFVGSFAMTAEVNFQKIIQERELKDKQVQPYAASSELDSKEKAADKIVNGPGSEGEPESIANCAKCFNSFEWDEAYKQQDTPGSIDWNPPGHSNYRPRVFCPYCGALIADWHITKEKDFDEWIWFADNAELNAGLLLPPSPIVFWGHSIPPQFRPHYDDHKLNIEQIKCFEKQKETDPHKQSADQGQWKQPLAEAKRHYRDGDIAKAVELLEQAVGAGLPKKEHATALGAFGDHYLEVKDVKTARKYYENSITTHFSGYWTAHLVLGFIYEVLGDSVKTHEKYLDAQRAEPNKHLDPAMEQKVRDIIREWKDTKDQ